MTTPPHWDWGVPGVFLPPPEAPNIDISTPRSWPDLKFDPASAWDLRRHLGAATDEPGRFMASLSKFLAADLGFLASGASTDGRHAVGFNDFFREFWDLRNATRQGSEGASDRKIFAENVRKLLFDLATILDRAIGSTTMVLSAEGTVAPGTPPRPEYLKAHVNILPSFLAENDASKPHIATIVQMFIEHVGVPTVLAWERRARAQRWTLSQPRRATSLASYLPLMPQPRKDSSHYIFSGRSAGWTPPPPPLANATAPSPVYDIDELTADDTALELSEALERNEILQAHIADLEVRFQEAHTQVEDLRGEDGVVADYETMQAELRARVMCLERDGTRLEHEKSHLEQQIVGLRAHQDYSVAAPSVPSTPSRSRGDARRQPQTPSGASLS
ncbi:hypothetical protein K438DRAFT_1974590 [Mycena galopus ATCC 62051]|nr:hypothetical protein K438DRAFT_1974590 [Mycena galopus ATCC 62051]